MKISKHIACLIVIVTAALMRLRASLWNKITIVTRSLMRIRSAIWTKENLHSMGRHAVAFTKLCSLVGLAGLYLLAVTWLVALFYEGMLRYYFPVPADYNLPVLATINLLIALLIMHLALRPTIPGKTKLTQFCLFSARFIAFSFVAMAVSSGFYFVGHDYLATTHLAAMLAFVWTPLAIGIHRLVKWAWATAPECALRG